MESAFQILSLDGGGIRGLFSAAILSSIEQDLQTKIRDHFDLIVGTSTGGIIAIGLGLGLEVKSLVDFYLDHCSEIFKNRFRLRSALQWVRRKYPAERLRQALQTELGDKLFGDSTKRLVIPTYNLGDDDVYLFRTPHHARLRRDWRVPAWQVALATAAAPTFFPAFRDNNHLRLIDGGVWANNPAMVGLVEAVGTLDVKIANIKILSIGTYDAVNSRPSRLDRGGKIAWGRDGAAIDIILRAQSIGVSNQVRFLLGPDSSCALIHVFQGQISVLTFRARPTTSSREQRTIVGSSCRKSEVFSAVIRPHHIDRCTRWRREPGWQFHSST